MREAVAQLYKPHVLAARTRFDSGAGKALFDPSLDPDTLELFLIYYCARAVQMTEPVESWIGRAGARCEKLGWASLGRALQMHAKHEADHHLMLVRDAEVLVHQWNEKHERRLDAAELGKIAPTQAIASYVRLHEDVIESDYPFCQVAIEYEIEGLSVSVGPGLLAQCKRLLGAEILEKLSFLTEHVEVDVGHTKFNEAELDRLLTANPGAADQLVRAGSAALDAYNAFMMECMQAARDTARA